MAPVQPEGGKAEQLLAWAVDNWPPILAAVLVVALVQLVLYLSKATRKPFLDPTAFKPLTLSAKTFLTHNTVRLRFALPYPDQRLGLPIGQHITFMAKDDDGKDIYRPYTPVSDDDQRGSVDFVIKLYPEGKMSKVISAMKVGDKLPMKGPRGRFEYKPNMVLNIGMLAGGTGITPMFQVINAILKNPKDCTKVNLLYGNLTVDDILLRKELDELVEKHGHRFSVYHVLTTPPPGWGEGGKGFITKDMIRDRIHPSGRNVRVLMCGPKPMCEAMKVHLDALEYEEGSQFQF